MSRRRVAGRADRGQASLELIGILPVLILGGLLALQMGIALWTVTSTTEAAREASRAWALGGSPEAAANASLPGVLTGSVQRGGGHTVTLTVDIPNLVLPLGSVTKTVIMP